jgi:hypothetical protein
MMTLPVKQSLLKYHTLYLNKTKGAKEPHYPAQKYLIVEQLLIIAKNTKHQIVLNDGLDVYKFLYPIAQG